MKILLEIMKFVHLTSLKHNIDESHSLGHSMKVLYNAHQIYQNTVHSYPSLKQQLPIIYSAAVLHDMCDKKYMNPYEGIKQINELLSDKMGHSEILFTKQIIQTMSYSTVKKYGYPSLGKYQMAYHIVREADLLAAYDVDRSIIYHMHKTNGNFTESYQNALDLFETRVFKHDDDQLFITEYSKMKSREYHKHALSQIHSWKYIVQHYDADYFSMGMRNV